MLRVIIAGGREFNDYSLLKEKMDYYLQNYQEITIICGKARGADTLGEKYAKEKGYKVIEYPADWNKFGKSAGPKRNMQMALNADACVCFWDGKSPGTDNMIRVAKGRKLKLKIVKYDS